MTVLRTYALDHIVLVVADVEATLAFYRDILGMIAREEKPGKWSLQAGHQKISLQKKGDEPQIARGTLPGSGNLCLLIEGDLETALALLADAGIETVSKPTTRDGATGPIHSVHLRDPDGNLVEIGVPLDTVQSGA